MIKFKHSGSFQKTERFFAKASSISPLELLIRYGDEGVAALSAATPVESGETAKSWGFEIVQTDNGVSIFWTNSHVNKGVNIAVVLQYGHGTRNGGFVLGRDYINPAIAPIFDKIAENAWKEVAST